MSDEVPLRNIIASKNILPADIIQRAYWGTRDPNFWHISNCIERQNYIFDEHYI